MTTGKINAIIIKLNDTEHERNERVQRKEHKMRQCWNWQTGTFEGRVSLTYGFKSRLPHQVKELANPLFIRVCEFFVLCRFCVWLLFGCYCDKNLRSRLLGLLLFVSCLFRLTPILPREDIRHSSESLCLSVLKSGGVYVKGGACLRVSENALNGLDVNA